MAINGVLLDLAGVAYKESRVIPGSLAAIGRLRSSKIPVRFMTNTTRLSKNEMLRTLKEIGLSIESDEPLMPIDAARNWLVANGATPHLLVHPAIADEFSGPPKGTHKAVVVGDAGTGFDYRGLNTAVRCLVEGAKLIPLAKNRSFRGDDGEFSLDAGPFVAPLEFAIDCETLVLGKPSPEFFQSVLASMGARRERLQ